MMRVLLIVTMFSEIPECIYIFLNGKIIVINAVGCTVMLPKCSSCTGTLDIFVVL